MLGVHIGLHLEHEPGDRLFFCRNLPLSRLLRLRLGAVLAHAVHQFLDPEGVDGRAEPDRRHGAVQEGGAVKGGQKFARHFNLFVELRQQIRWHMFGQFRVIHARNLDRFCHLVAVGAVHNLQPVVQEIIGAHKLAPNADGPAGRGDINRQILLNLVDDLKHIAAFAVHLVAKGQDRQVTQPADLKQLLRLAFHALGPVDHHDRGVHSGEGAVGILRKIRVTGGVDQIEAELAVVKGHGRGGYRNAAVGFDLHEV